MGWVRLSASGVLLSAELAEGNKAGMFAYVKIITHPRFTPLVVTHNTDETQCATQFEIMLQLRNTEILLN